MEMEEKETKEINNEKKVEDIQPYLDFLKFEIERAIKRKNSLENKAIVLGTLFSSILSMIFINNRELIEFNCRELGMFTVFLFLIFMSIATYFYLYKVLKLEKFLYNKGDISVEKILKASKEKQQKNILEDYKKILDLIHKNCDEKGKNLNSAVFCFSIFFALVFLMVIINK